MSPRFASFLTIAVLAAGALLMPDTPIRPMRTH